MTENFNSFELSPVPPPATDAVPPPVHRGIYGMPMFLTVPTTDLQASAQFWIEALGFIDLFSVPGQLTHLRRWAFQDVLLVPAPSISEISTITVSFACVLSQLDPIARACEQLRPGSTTGPRHMPWNSVELEVITPENARVILTAAKPLDPGSQEAAFLQDIGIDVPGPERS